MDETTSWPLPPAGLRIYAVGDIHGMSALLDDMLQHIRDDLAERPPHGPVRIVFLGDYIDRGPDSAGTLRRLAGLRIEGAEIVCLRGNHEEALLWFLADPLEAWPHWLTFGGAATLASFGVQAPRLRTDRRQILAAHAALRRALPRDLVVFLERLPHYHAAGDYVFVHAGLRPDVPLQRQDPHDLVWIRDTFLDHTGRFSHFVVHGHTPVAAPDVRDNRIGIDTGAYHTGVLTCLLLQDAGRWTIRSGSPRAVALGDEQ